MMNSSNKNKEIVMEIINKIHSKDEEQLINIYDKFLSTNTGIYLLI
jgi:hypothetical protein